MCMNNSPLFKFQINMNYLLSLTLVVVTLGSAVIPVPAETEVAEVFVRIGEYKEITTPPEYPFQTIYSKKVYQLDENNNMKDFSAVCQEVPADIQFNSTFTSRLDIYETSVRNDVITTFEEIKADRKILDTILFKGKVYLLLRDNILLVFNAETNEMQRNLQIPSLAEKQSIEIGFFVEVNSKLFLLTRYEAFVLDDYFKRLEGYGEYADFESARELFGPYFAVCRVGAGIHIYSYENNKLELKQTLDAQFFGRNSLFISDLAYNPDKKEMFVSDLKFGINIVKLEVTDGNFKATLASKGYRKVGCNVIVYVDGNLYASCDDLFKVRYSTDEAIIDMPNPMFRVKELLVYKGLVVAVGEDLITKYYNDKLTEETPEFDITERLIFYANNKYLMANYYGVQAGTFEIQYPSIECYTENKTAEGIVNAVIKTQAECSTPYLNKYSVKLPQTPGVTDSCLYTSPVQLIFWESEEFNMEIIFMILGVLFLVAAIIVTWAIFIFNKEVHLKRTLEMYTNPNSLQMVSGTQIQGYNVMVEEKLTGSDVSDTNKELHIDSGTHSID